MYLSMSVYAYIHKCMYTYTRFKRVIKILRTHYYWVLQYLGTDFVFIPISGWESPACGGELVSLDAWSRSETDSHSAGDTPADTHSQSAGGDR